LSPARNSSPPFLRRRNRKPGAFQRFQRIALLVAGGVAVYALILGESGWLRISAERSAVEELQSEIQRLQADQARILQQLDALEEPSSLELERAARDQYGLVREGERVLYVVEPQPTP